MVGGRKVINAYKVNAKKSMSFEETGVGADKVIIQAPSALGGDYTLILPTTDGDASQALITDGSGVLSWGSSGVSDHGSLTGLDDSADHAWASLIDGTRAFTGTVGGIPPVASSDLATKEYVDTSISFIDEFFFNDTASGIGGIYYKMEDLPTGEGESTFLTENLGTDDDQPLTNFATEEGIPGVNSLRAGTYSGHIHVAKTDGTKPLRIYFAVYTRTHPGGFEVRRAKSEVSGLITSKTDISLHATIDSDIDINTTDRIIYKWFANVGVTGNPVDVTLYAEGENVSRANIPTGIEVLSSIFIRQDGTTPLTANWDVGNFDITAKSLTLDGTLNCDGDAIFNEAGADKDFRIEGVGQPNAFFVQGSDGFVGIGNGAPQATLEISAASNPSLRISEGGDTANFFEFIDVLDGQAQIQKTTQSGHVVIDLNPKAIDGTSDASIRLFRETTTTGSRNLIIHKGNGAAIITHQLGSDGTIFNEEGVDINFRIEAVGKTHALFLEGSSGNLGSNISIPLGTFHGVRAGVNNLLYLDTYGNSIATQYISRRAQGTIATPTAVLSNDQLGTFSFRGYNGVGFTGSKGTILVRAKEDWDESSNGTSMEFSTTDNGSTTLDLRMLIDHNGNVGIGISNPLALLSVDGDAIFNESGADKDFRIEAVSKVNGFFFQGSSGNVGLNTNNPLVAFHVVRDGTNNAFFIDTYGTGLATQNAFRAARGTVASPTAVQAGDTLGSFSFRGYMATGFSGSKAIIQGNANENWTDAANGTFLSFSTTDDGTTTPDPRMRIDHNGNIGIGTTNPNEILHIKKAGFAAIKTESTGNGNPSGLLISRERNSGENVSAAGIYVDSDTSTNHPQLVFQLESGLTFGDIGTARMVIGDGAGNDGFVGIGTVTPITTLHVEGDTFFIRSSTAYMPQIRSDAIRNATDASYFNLRKARGSIGSETAVVNSDVLGTFNFAGYDGTNYISACGLTATVRGTVSTGVVPSSLAFTVMNNAGSINTRLYIYRDVGVFIGDGSIVPQRILHIAQGKGHMIADGYDPHSLAEYKENIVPVNSQGMIEKFKSFNLYEFTKKPYVSAEELRALVIKEFGTDRWIAIFGGELNNKGKVVNDEYHDEKMFNCPDPEMLDFINETAESKRVELRKLPKWQRKHLGLVADDPDTIANAGDIISRDDDGKITGYSLVSYVGFLHGVIKELISKVEHLEVNLS